MPDTLLIQNIIDISINYVTTMLQDSRSVDVDMSTKNKTVISYKNSHQQIAMT